MDVVRLFMGAVTFQVNPEGEAQLVHTFTQTDGQWQCGFSYQGHHAQRCMIVPQSNGAHHQALLYKRYQKRLCKQTLYDVLKAATGVHPPWGSLTGIRPTRLMYEALGEGMDNDQAERYLQREFDVTPEKTQVLSQIVKVQQTMAPADENQVDVYIGIPFCESRCAYCSFLSGEIGDGRWVAPYLQALEVEMRSTARLMQEKHLKLRAVYIGGGTPTSLNAAQLVQLLGWMRRDFSGAVEYTVEAGRPDSITYDKLRCIQDAGVTRISLNPQTMVDETLVRIGRGHTVHQVYESYELARSLGFSHINMDVIAGLPGETLNEFAITMAQAKALHPESLTVHTLAIKRATRLHLNNAPLPQGDMVAPMVRLGRDTAQTMGLMPYYLYRQKYMAGNQENVGYALPRHACQYNVDIMEETTHILAVGAGAISKRIYPDEGRIERSANVSNIQQYIERVDEMILRKQALWQAADALNAADNAITRPF